MPMACGFTTRKLDLLPLLLLQARSGRVRSSPRTYSAAWVASPAGGRRGLGEGGDSPAARGQEIGARDGRAMTPGPQPLPSPAAAAAARLSSRRPAPQVAQEGGPAGLRVFALARSCTPFLRLYPRSGHQDENSEENRPWICSVCRNPTLNATRVRVSASHGCRVGRNGQ